MTPSAPVCRTSSSGSRRSTSSIASTARHQAFDDNARIWNDYAAQANRDAEQGRLPGNAHIHAERPTPAQAQAGEKAKAAKATADAQIKELSKDYPIFAEDDLPVDKRVDKTALAQASETQLAGVLQTHIAKRTAVVTDARGQLEGKHELIYKMDKLMPAFYAEMDIQPGSIHDQIIKDKLHDDAIAKLVVGVLLAVAAIALTVVSLGAATPAIAAAGASIGAAGLGTHMAYDEYKQYTAEHAVAEAGFADDPSVVSPCLRSRVTREPPPSFSMVSVRHGTSKDSSPARARERSGS